MKDFNIRHMLAVLPIVVAIAAAVFIVQAGTHDAAIAPVRQAVDMDVPFAARTTPRPRPSPKTVPVAPPRAISVRRRASQSTRS